MEVSTTTSTVQEAREKHKQRQRLLEDLDSLYTHRTRWEEATSIHHAVVLISKSSHSNNSEQVIIPDAIFSAVRALTLDVLNTEIKKAETKLLNL